MSPFLYLKHFIQDKQVASITPTSQVAVEQICKHVNWDKVKVVIEYGPGNGVFTRHILSLLGSDAKLVALELNPDFAALLKSKLNDPRCVILNTSAENVSSELHRLGITAADLVISGIPFSLLREITRERIVKRTRNALKPEGKFITYQVFPKPPSAKRPLKKLLSKYFSTVTAEYEFRNIPPLEVLVATKNT